MARRKKSGGEGGEPAWLITFSDLMTLLLTFFVLLLSMAVIDERHKLVVLSSVAKAFSSNEVILNPLSDKPSKSNVEPGAMEGPRDDLAPMRDMLFDDVDKDLNFQENKYVQIFSINDEVLFMPGGAILKPEGVALLDRILPYLQRIDFPLLVAGHTASRRDEEGNQYNVRMDQKNLDSTWSLSFNRANAVYRHLQSRGIQPGRLSLEAFGQYHPRYSNNTPDGRKKNRRVDLVLDKRNLEWIQKVEALKEPEAVKNELYYQGFRFDLTMPGTSLPPRAPEPASGSLPGGPQGNARPGGGAGGSGF